MVARAKFTEVKRLSRPALLEALLDAAPVGLAFLDADLRFIRLNAALGVDARRGSSRRGGTAVLRRCGGRCRAIWPRGCRPLWRTVLPALDHEARLQGTRGGSSTHVWRAFIRYATETVASSALGSPSSTSPSALRLSRPCSEARRSRARSSAHLWMASSPWTRTAASSSSTLLLRKTSVYRAVEVIGREVADTIVPPSLRDMHRAESRPTPGRRVSPRHRQARRPGRSSGPRHRVSGRGGTGPDRRRRASAVRRLVS